MLVSQNWYPKAFGFVVIVFIRILIELNSFLQYFSRFCRDRIFGELPEKKKLKG